MELGAYIDQNGNAYVANIENVEYLHSNMPKKFTRVLSEDGGEVVTVADIEFALSRHRTQWNSTFFDCEETMDFYIK